MIADRASSSLYALVIVLVLSLLCGAAMIGMGGFLASRERAGNRERARASLDQALEGWMTLYGKSAGSDDSSFDDYSGTVSVGGVDVVAEDVSSRINPNWVNTNVLEKTALASLLLPGTSPAELQQYRVDEGFSVDIENFYARFFSPKAFEDYLSPYSYADINTTDEFALAGLYALRAGQVGGAEAFHAKLREYRRTLRPVGVDELEELLSPSEAQVFPSIAVAAPMNVNFVPAPILSALIGYPDYGILDAQDRARVLIAERDARELTMERVYGLLGVARENPVYRYLGTKTWFWRLRMQQDGVALEAIVARMPPRAGQELEAEKSPQLRLVVRKFRP